MLMFCTVSNKKITIWGVCNIVSIYAERLSFSSHHKAVRGNYPWFHLRAEKGKSIVSYT